MLRTRIAETISGRPVLYTVVLASAALLGLTTSSQSMLGQTMLGQTAPSQAKATVPRAAALLDLPIVMQQKVAAGKTTV